VPVLAPTGRGAADAVSGSRGAAPAARRPWTDQTGPAPPTSRTGTLPSGRRATTAPRDGPSYATYPAAKSQLTVRNRVSERDTMGARAFAQRAKRELQATGEKVRKRSDPHTDLTPQEEQIAQLAREGQTNQEIGAQLFIGVHTVEWHLRNIFAKLGIASRRELDKALSGRGHPSAPPRPWRRCRSLPRVSPHQTARGACWQSASQAGVAQIPRYCPVSAAVRPSTTSSCARQSCRWPWARDRAGRYPPGAAAE
jgi:DNA-binding CsgD family transcriptional regulator